METQQTSYKIAKDLVSNPLHNLIDVELPGSEQSNIFANFKRNINIIRATIISSTRYSKNIHLKNFNTLIFPHLNINSIRKKIDLLVVTLFKEDIDGFIIPEIKIDFSFLTAQFHNEGYATPYRLDRDINSSNLFLLIR